MKQARRSFLLALPFVGLLSRWRSKHAPVPSSNCLSSAQVVDFWRAWKRGYVGDGGYLVPPDVAKAMCREIFGPQFKSKRIMHAGVGEGMKKWPA